MIHGMRNVFRLALAGLMVGVLGLSGCGGGGGSSSTGGTLPQTSIAPTATLDGWTPNDSTLLQYKTYTFAASATDPNIGGSITEFRWDFGDGTTRTTPVVLSGGKATTTATYSYVASGTPTLSVVAKNAAGLLSTAATKSLTVGTSPSPLTVSFTSPTAATLINAVLGNSVTLTYKVNVVYTGFGTVSASGVTLDPGEATATKATPVDAGGGNYTIAVTYAAATAMGSRTVTPSVKVVDSNGVSSTTVLGPAITIKTVSATNTAPIISLTAASTPAAGTNATWQNVDVVFTAIASDPDEDPLSYTWDLGDGTVITGTTELTQTHKYSRPGLYSVKVTANDGRTGGTKTADLTLNVLVNRAPTVVVTKALPTGNPTKYQRVTLNAAVTDLDSDLPTVTWNFGDGTPPETGTPVVHQFKAAGVSTIVATVDDGKGGSGSSTLLLTVVENNPPVAAVTTASAELFQNKVYTFTATASDIDTADTIASYEWDFGNGVVVAGGASQTHVFPVTVTGAVAVRARAIDSRGAVGDWSPAVNFTVVATKLPIVTFTIGDKVSFNATSADQVIAEFLVSVTNPNGAAGTFLPVSALTVVAGDAAGTVQTIINHQDGTYTIPVKYLAAGAVGARSVFPALVALDDLGIASNAVAATATVNTVAAVNVTPVATLVSAPKFAAAINATWMGVDVVFTATGSDPDGDLLVYTWDFGDGTVLSGMLGSAALIQTHKYAVAGNYSVKLTADDGRARGTKIADLTLSVLANAAPTVVVTKTSPGGDPTKYQRVTLLATVTDTDATTLTWNFGDGSAPVLGTATMVHQFQAAGLTNITATADDGKGGVTSGALQLNIVENNPPVAAMTTTAASLGNLLQNKSYTFTATASDPDGDAIASYEWDFGNGAVVAGGASQTHVFPVTVTGAVAVRARAIDSRGAVGAWSPAVSFTVTATQVPVVAFTSPAVSLSLNVGSYIDQDILFSVTNPNVGLGATIPLPGGIVFSTNDGAATVPAGVVSLGGTSYKATVRYSAAGSSGSRSHAPSASAQDSLNIPATPIAVSGALVTVVTGTFGEPTIGVTVPATNSNTAYVLASISLGFTLGNPAGNPTTYTVDWDSVNNPGVTTTTATVVDPTLTTTGVPVSLTHIYPTVGTYTIAITAVDGRSDSTRTAVPQSRIFVIGTNALPTATITSPQASGVLPALASIISGGQGMPTIPAGLTDPDVVVIPANGKLVFNGTGTPPDSGGSITYSWVFNGGVPNASLVQNPGEVFFPGVANQITAYRVDLTVTDALGRPSVNSAKARSKWVIVDALNTQDFNLNFLYRQIHDGTDPAHPAGSATLAPVVTGAGSTPATGHGLGATIQIFQDGVTYGYPVRNASGTTASITVPVRSNIPFWLDLPASITGTITGASGDSRDYFMRIPNSPVVSGSYYDPSLVNGTPVSGAWVFPYLTNSVDPTAQVSTFGFQNPAAASGPWNPTLNLVTAQGFAPETGSSPMRKLQGSILADHTASTGFIINNANTDLWLDRLSVPALDPSTALTDLGVVTDPGPGLSFRMRFNNISAYQLFAEWVATLETNTATGTNTDVAFNLDHGKQSGSSAAATIVPATALRAFRVPSGSTDPYDLDVAGWADATSALNPANLHADVSTFFSQMTGNSASTGGLRSLTIPYDGNDPDRKVIQVPADLKTYDINILGTFSYADYLWSRVWARPLVLNASALRDVDSIGNASKYYYSNVTSGWPKIATAITPDNSTFDITPKGGTGFVYDKSPVGTLSSPVVTTTTSGVGRFYWTAYTPTYNANNGWSIARTWLAQGAADAHPLQPPTSPSGSGAGYATSYLGFVPPQDTVVDKRGRTATGALNGNALGGYRVTWFNPTKDTAGDPVAPDFWVIQLTPASGAPAQFMLAGSFPATYPTYAFGGINYQDPEAIPILTDSRVAMARLADRTAANGIQVVAPGYCWFDIPVELRPAAGTTATLTVLALKSVPRIGTAGRPLNRTEWIEAIKTATGRVTVESGAGDLGYAYKIPFNYYWDIVITNGPATPVAP